MMADSRLPLCTVMLVFPISEILNAVNLEYAVTQFFVTPPIHVSVCDMILCTPGRNHISVLEVKYLELLAAISDSVTQCSVDTPTGQSTVVLGLTQY